MMGLKKPADADMEFTAAHQRYLAQITSSLSPVALGHLNANPRVPELLHLRRIGAVVRHTFWPPAPAVAAAVQSVRRRVVQGLTPEVL